VENGLTETGVVAHTPKELYITRTLVSDHQEVPMRVLNAVMARSSKKDPPWHIVSQ
jgi:hypothetical protein